MTTELDESATETEIDLEAVAEVASKTIHQAIQNAATNTARSQQQRDALLGISDLGHCRAFSTLMTRQVEPSENPPKTAAFFGTVAGDAIEKQIKIDHPDWETQSPVVFPIPSGGEIPGTADIVIPFSAQDPENGIYQSVWDLKSKAELETIKKMGPTQQQVFQVHAYAKGKIEDGTLNPDYPILVGDVYFDRSGRDQTPYGVFHLYSEDVVGFMDEWINDVKYAVMHNEDASRDQPREFCQRFCEQYTNCRGQDTDVEGLVTDPEFVSGVDVYREGLELEKAGKKKKDAAKIAIGGRSGSTGEFTVRWVKIDETIVKEQKRAGYEKISITPVPKPKKKATKK